MEAAAGHRLPDDGVALAHALRRETGGNPFFVVEMILHLAQEGIFAQGDDGMWRLTVDLDEIGLPTSVREVVAQRVANLGEETERALSMASVIGRDFDLSVLSAVLEQDELELGDLLEGATMAGLLQEVAGDADRYRFVHALIQHTLYQDLTATRRRRGHLRVAEVLEDTETDDPRAPSGAGPPLAGRHPRGGCDQGCLLRPPLRPGSPSLLTPRPTPSRGSRKPSRSSTATVHPGMSVDSSSSTSAPPRTTSGCPNTDRPSSTRPRSRSASATPIFWWRRPSEGAAERVLSPRWILNVLPSSERPSRRWASGSRAPGRCSLQPWPR